MYTIGISCYFHDSAIAVLKDGELIFFSLEDRFSRIKHDSEFPNKAIDYIREDLGLDISSSDVEGVGFYEDNEAKFLALLNETLEGYPTKFRDFFRVIPQWILKKFWIKSKIALKFGVELGKVSSGDHHLSHALYGYHSSEFEESLVICSDGYGDHASLTAYEFKHGKHRELFSYDKMNSLGLVYTTFTTFFGFKANDGECSLMALSRFGRPKYKELMYEALSVDEKHIFKINPHFFNFSLDAECFFTDYFIEKFGKPFKGSYSVSSFEHREVSEQEQYYLDLAASFHEVFEEIYDNIFKTAYDQSPIRKFVFVGGVAQNCVLVARLEKLPFVEKIHIPLDPGDGGGAIGAAIAVSQAKNVLVNQTFAGTRLSQKKLCSLKDIISTIGDLSFEEMSQDELAQRVSSTLLQGEVIGLFGGAMEVGPRALGHRSLICLPDNQTTVNRLSKQVKSRAEYRPYALIMLEEEAYQFVEGYRPSPLLDRMQTLVKIKNEYREKVHFGLHIDGTTRLQVVREKDNEFLYQVLVAMKEKLGHSCLINTSFNESGLPLIQSPVDALYFFQEKPMGMLIIDNLLVSKSK